MNKPSSKERTTYLLAQLAIRERRLVNTQKEIDGIKHELSGWGRESRCWSCKGTGDTTDLVDCELRNVNYPVCCEDYRESKVSRFKEKHLYGWLYHPPEICGPMLGRWIPIVFTDWPKIPVRERFFKDRLYYYRFGGMPKPWNRGGEM